MIFVIETKSKVKLSFVSTSFVIVIVLFIVQCWAQASKPEPLKQDIQKEKKKRK